MENIINEKNEVIMKQYDYEGSIIELEFLVATLGLAKCAVLETKDRYSNKKIVFGQIKELSKLTKICNEMIVDMKKLKYELMYCKGRSNIYGNFEMVKFSVLKEVRNIEHVTGISIFKVIKQIHESK